MDISLLNVWNASEVELKCFLLYPWLVLVFTYWGLGLALLPLDFWSTIREMNCVKNRKCQPSKKPSVDDVKTIMYLVGRQMVTVYPIAIYAMLPLMRRFISLDDSDIPSTFTFCWYLMYISFP